MLISIITPVYNRENCIGRAIKSVSNLKLPKGIDYEHIIINDGSTDKTDESVINLLDKKIKYIHYKNNKGVNYARNKGIKEGEGDYILLFDSDDELIKDALIIINKTLNKNKGFMIYLFESVNKKGVMGISSVYNENISYKQRLSGVIQGEFITLINKKVFDKMMFDENLMAFEMMFWNKVSRMFESEIVVPEIIRIYHDEEENRLCRQLVDPKHARKRVTDYKIYLNEFQDDYIKFGLHKQLSVIYQIIGFYLALSDYMEEARLYFIKSGNIKSMISFILTYIGVWPFRWYAFSTSKQ